MAFEIDPVSGKILVFYQFLKPNPKKPKTLEEALEDESIIVFYPEQIIFLDYGLYGSSREEIFGYLEKVKQPFNQLKLLETSLIIYRIVKAPERLVFSIDTGAMPMDKAMKFVEKIKQKLTQKVSYDSRSGSLHNQPEIMSMLDNYFLPQCLRLDTEISCLDGIDKTLSQMIDDFNNGIKNEVLSVDQSSGKIIHGEVEWAGITRKDAELVRVHLDSGKCVDVTPDHKFVMRDGSEVEAQHLSHDDSLMPYYTRDEKICSTSNDYKQVYDNCDDEWKFIHRIVKCVGGGNVVHHQDFDRYNNMSDNLIEMRSLDHLIYHSSLGSDTLKKLWKDDDFREMMVETAKKTANRWKDGDFRTHMSTIQKGIVNNRIISIFTKLYIDANKPSMDVFRNILSNDNGFMGEWLSLNKDKKNIKNDYLGKTSFYNIIKHMGFSDYTEFKKGVVINHRVDYVENLSIKEDTGCLTIKDAGNNHNFPLSIGVFVKNSSDGRGSSIDSVGGNPSGFAEIDDIWYFARKLYVALKYPMSRITNMQEGRSGDNMFMGSQTGEINRDEIRWAKFLERNQHKFTKSFTKLFLLHLEFMGLKHEYELDESKINITMTPPNNYKQQMGQMLLESQMNNYQNVANNPEISKSFAQTKYLKWTEEDLKANSDGFKRDKELYPVDEF
jgi:hypothetical protein